MSYTIPFDVPAYSYQDSLDALHAALRFGICPLVETVEDMLEELGNPDLCFESLQIAGTNGKTSTSRYTAAILANEGYKVALYTSPELVEYTERMEVDGSPISKELFAKGIAAAVRSGERVNDRRRQEGQPSYDITEFDTLTVAAMVAFALEGVEVAVLEVGMGGRWDATSAVKSIKSVAVTGIGLDHMRVLGDTLEQIAAEKAAVIQRGRSCVLGVGTSTPDSVQDVFLQQAKHEGVEPILIAAEDLSDVQGIMHPGSPRVHEDLFQTTFAIQRHPSKLGDPIRLRVDTQRAAYRDLLAYKPAYQGANIACAITLAEEYMGHALDAAALGQSVVACPTPGRFDVVRHDPLALVDACHNPQSVEVFLTAIRDMSPNVADRPALLCAVLSDKDVRGIVELLSQEFPRVVVTQTSSLRALPANELAAVFSELGTEPAGVFANVRAAIEALEDVPFVACGSITTAGEVIACLR